MQKKVRKKFCEAQRLKTELLLGSPLFLAIQPLPMLYLVHATPYTNRHTGVPHHLTQRGNDRRVVFPRDADYLQYLEFLCEYTGKYRVAVHMGIA